MKTNWKHFFISILAFIVFTSSHVYSKDKDSIDVVLVMDSSGSMKKTDPMSLRIPAAKLFISLLDKNDRASVVSFSDKSSRLIDLTPVDSEINKEQLLKAADDISSSGMFTNLYEALVGGHKILSEGEKDGRSKIIVLMSDGMMDVGDTDKDRVLVDKIKNEMAANLEDKGIKVYAIAFTEQSDRLLLEKISKRTGGFYNLAMSDKDFHLIFTSIFESLKSPDMLPVTENGFLVDGSIEEVTIVATKGSPDTQIRLNSPDGSSFTNKEKSTGIDWFVSDNFDMITIKAPAGGKWDILFSTGDNNKAYIITNLKLQTNFDQLYSTFGDPLDIKIWLEKDGVTIKEQELLDKFKLYIELTGPDGKVSKLEPFNKGEGIFVRNIAPFTPGNYKMKIIAQGNTFEREKDFVFNIADVKESKQDILVKKEKQKKAEEKTGHITTEEENTKNVSWQKVIVQFLSVNLAIGIILLFYFKRKSLKNIKGINKILFIGKLRNILSRDEAGSTEQKVGLKKDSETQVEHNSMNEELKQKKEIDPAESKKEEHNEVLEAEVVNKHIEEHANVTEQKEKALIKTIPLDDSDSEREKLEAENLAVRQESETVQQKLENEVKNVYESPDITDDSQWHDIDSNKDMLTQDDLNQLLETTGKEDSADVTEEQLKAPKLEEGDEILDTSQTGKDSQEKTDNNIKSEVIDDIEALWQEALESQNHASEGVLGDDNEGQISALDLEIERLEKARQEEIIQNTAKEDQSEELTVQDNTESRKDEASNENADDNIMEKQQEDIDAIWQEAMLQQKAAEGEKLDNKEGTSSD